MASEKKIFLVENGRRIRGCTKSSRMSRLGELNCVLDLLNQVFQRKHLGPVVQSIVSLTSSLRGQLVKCFTTI